MVTVSYAEVEGVYVQAVTDKAILVEWGGEEFWLPRSQIRDGFETWLCEGFQGDIEVVEWLADEKGLV